MKKASVPNSSMMRPLSILSVSRTASPSDRDTMAVASAMARAIPSAGPCQRQASGSARPSCQTEASLGSWTAEVAIAGVIVPPKCDFASHLPSIPTPPNALRRRGPGKSAKTPSTPEREVLAQLGGEVARRGRVLARAQLGGQEAVLAAERVRVHEQSRARAHPRRSSSAGATRRPRRAARCGPSSGPTASAYSAIAAQVVGRGRGAGPEQLHERDGELARAAPAGSRPRRTARTRARRGGRARCGAARRRARARAAARSSGGRPGASSRGRSRRTSRAARSMTSWKVGIS